MTATAPAASFEPKRLFARRQAPCDDPAEVVDLRAEGDEDAGTTVMGSGGNSMDIDPASV